MSPSTNHQVEPDGFAVVRGYFDKTPETNWLVPWHQDLTLALAGTTDVPGFGPWSTKAAFPMCSRPPVSLNKC